MLYYVVFNRLTLIEFLLIFCFNIFLRYFYFLFTLFHSIYSSLFLSLFSEKTPKIYKYELFCFCMALKKNDFVSVDFDIYANEKLVQTTSEKLGKVAGLNINSYGP